jgi:Zn-dependent alcohol dehydrogenase
VIRQVINLPERFRSNRRSTGLGGSERAVAGMGGIGINAVQGVRYAGAKNLIAIDPLENKREKAHGL